jgi:hypothetical protein
VEAAFMVAAFTVAEVTVAEVTGKSVLAAERIGEQDKEKSEMDL